MKRMLRMLLTSAIAAVNVLLFGVWVKLYMEDLIHEA